ncbi:hypothetical protein C3486_34690 [Streptomyces sp. Ru73]|uniref:Rid family hydrolase n=1 Tax=Streptomyces sp. Ru73 TaxID=2080748 RepID=UPI000CDCEA1F|nr:hypothetical protein C3486_34690 [Streptomyces sp. Ru73]
MQVSGRLPLDRDTGEVIGTTVAEQTAQTCATSPPCSRRAARAWDVVMLRVYLTDPAHLAEMNRELSVWAGGQGSTYRRWPSGRWRTRPRVLRGHAGQAPGDQ